MPEAEHPILAKYQGDRQTGDVHRSGGKARGVPQLIESGGDFAQGERLGTRRRSIEEFREARVGITHSNHCVTPHVDHFQPPDVVAIRLDLHQQVHRALGHPPPPA
jgi:hypothetical protein